MVRRRPPPHAEAHDGAAARVACAIETLRTALDARAVAAPDWLRARADTAWAERYERRGGDVHIPKGEAARRAFAETIGRDGEALPSAVTAPGAPGAPAWLREVPAVEILRRAWVQDFCRLDDDAGPSKPDKPMFYAGARKWKAILHLP